MKIIKILSMSLFILMFANIKMYAQTPSNPSRNIQELMTPLKPADGQPYVFYSLEELKAAQDKKAESIKRAIRESFDNEPKVKALRENLWRLENAMVQELPKNN